MNVEIEKWNLTLFVSSVELFLLLHEFDNVKEVDDVILTPSLILETSLPTVDYTQFLFLLLHFCEDTRLVEFGN